LHVSGVVFFSLEFFELPCTLMPNIFSANMLISQLKEWTSHDSVDFKTDTGAREKCWTYSESLKRMYPTVADLSNHLVLRHFIIFLVFTGI
jgi:hypothetical protein